ncbi:MAG: HAMP domain-containing sensor histidine kinase [Chloroflexota bacterium]|nr:HAMP domain-containing sensor histidine kinase [Chloroflexota bacterium]
MNLRWRLVLSHTLIVVLCLTIIAVAVIALLQNYRYAFAMARLDDMTVPIYVQARALARGEASLNEVWGTLKEQAQETDVHILLVDAEGNIVRQATPQGGVRGRLSDLPQGTLPDDLSEPYHGTYRISTGQTIVFVAYPLLLLSDAPTTSVVEALVLAVPIGNALALWRGFSLPFLWAGLIALAVSIVIAIFLARSIYRPIIRVTDAAGEVAQGRYGQEIPLTGPAEVRGLARAFNQMSRQVQLSQQRLREFLADVSHELRTPLTSIRGFAQAIADKTASDSEAQARAAQIIEDESKRVIRLVDELLELSKIESGQIEMLREPVDVTALLENCQEIFALRVQENNIRLQSDLEQLPHIVGDSDRLEQVFSNLLDNALKHTPSGGDVNIGGRQTSSGFVEIVVADSGPGIPPQELPNVFRRFYKADAGGAGTGLGLAIAREIVRAHGGDIEARNVPVGGAEFTVRLPVSGSSI